jgi:hypothetical protein
METMTKRFEQVPLTSLIGRTFTVRAVAGCGDAIENLSLIDPSTGEEFEIEPEMEFNGYPYLLASRRRQPQ